MNIKALLASFTSDSKNVKHERKELFEEFVKTYEPGKAMQEQQARIKEQYREARRLADEASKHRQAISKFSGFMGKSGTVKLSPDVFAFAEDGKAELDVNPSDELRAELQGTMKRYVPLILQTSHLMV